MIHIHTRRAGCIVIASTVNDFREVTSTWGLTVRSSEQRLIRLLDRQDGAA